MFIDQSKDSYEQTNDYDYGVFTLISMTLLVQGVKLRATTYIRDMVYLRQSCSQLAHIIWSLEMTTSLTMWLAVPPP